MELWVEKMQERECVGKNTAGRGVVSRIIIVRIMIRRNTVAKIIVGSTGFRSRG